MGPLVGLGLATGLRLGELLGLAWGAEGLDITAGVVRVRRSLDRTRGPAGRFAIVAPKSAAGVRDVPLGPSELARVRRHRLATGRPRAGELVFADERGLPLDANGLPRYGWHRIRRVADEPLHRFRDLRHAWAVYSLRAGLRPEAVAQLGGWSDVAMVTRRYGRHPLPDEVADAGALLEAWRGGWGRGG